MMGSLPLIIQVVLYALVFVMLTAGVLSALQEGKAFRDVPLPLYGYLKTFCFVELWMIFSGVGSLIALPFWLVGVNVNNFVIDYVEYYTATVLCRLLVGKIEVKGAENLPEVDTKRPVVYCFNHQVR